MDSIGCFAVNQSEASKFPKKVHQKVWFELFLFLNTNSSLENESNVIISIYNPFWKTFETFSKNHEPPFGYYGTRKLLQNLWNLDNFAKKRLLAIGQFSLPLFGSQDPVHKEECVLVQFCYLSKKLFSFPS